MHVMDINGVFYNVVAQFIRSGPRVKPGLTPPPAIHMVNAPRTVVAAQGNFDWLRGLHSWRYAQILLPTPPASNRG